MSARLERLLNLVIALRDASRPMTTQEIIERVAGYAGADTTSERRKFERDKADLRRLGIPVQLVAIDRWGDEEGYSIPDRDYALSPIELDSEEMTALAVAVGASDLDAGGALRKLAAADAHGGSVERAPAGAGGLGSARPGQLENAPPGLRLSLDAPHRTALVAALRERRVVEFTYATAEQPSSRRSIEPAGLVHRGGRWYLVGRDRGRAADRAFRLDRIVSAVEIVGAADAYERQDGVAVDDVLPPARPVAIEVAVTQGVAGEVARVARGSGTPRADGRTAYVIEHRDLTAGLSWALGRAPEVVVVGPPEAADLAGAVLRGLACAPGGEQPVEESVPPPEATHATGVPPPRDLGHRNEGADRGPRPAGDALERLDRLLAIVPYVLAHPGSPLDLLAERFGGTPDQIAEDLDLLGYCGVPGYGGGDLVETRVVGDRVTIHMAEWFRRPLRLTLPEALSLVLAGRAMAAVPGFAGSPALERALSRLEEAAGLTGLVTAIDLAAPGEDLVPAARAAVERRQVVRLTHRRPEEGEPVAREVEPWAVMGAAGAWYLRGWCHRAQGPRDFRLDRVQSLEPTGARAAAPPVDAGTDPPRYTPEPEHPWFALCVAPEARWLADLVAVDRVDDVVVARARSLDWAARLTLAGVGGARVRGPRELADRVARLAERTLELMDEARREL